MQNLVDQYTAEAPEANDEGVVAIEYVLVAAAVAAGVITVFTSLDLWGTMAGKLNGLFK